MVEWHDNLFLHFKFQVTHLHMEMVKKLFKPVTLLLHSHIVYKDTHTHQSGWESRERSPVRISQYPTATVRAYTQLNTLPLSSRPRNGWNEIENSFVSCLAWLKYFPMFLFECIQRFSYLLPILVFVCQFRVSVAYLWAREEKMWTTIHQSLTHVLEIGVY